MAEENNDDLSLENAEQNNGGGKKKLIIIIVAAVLLLGGGAGAFFFFFSGDDDQGSEAAAEASAEETSVAVKASYVPMPRPFVFNVKEGKRDRLVQIKVQLLVRGSDKVALVRKHVPLLEDTLVHAFAAASAEQLRSPEGKVALRDYSLKALNEATNKVESKALIDLVLFTGFVLQ